jgi:hypothetical protein
VCQVAANEVILEEKETTVKSEFVPPTYLNVGQPEEPRLPSGAMTFESAAATMGLDGHGLMTLVNEGKVKLIPVDLPMRGVSYVDVGDVYRVLIERQQQNSKST